MLKARGVGIIYISHMLDEIFAVCDTMTVMRDGRVVEDCQVKDMNRPHLVRKFSARSWRPKVGPAAQQTRQSARHRRNPAELREAQPRRASFADISFDVCAGEIFCVTGLIGAKRSELMRTIFGADRFDSGTLLDRKARR